MLIAGSKIFAFIFVRSAHYYLRCIFSGRLAPSLMFSKCCLFACVIYQATPSMNAIIDATAIYLVHGMLLSSGKESLFCIDDHARLFIIRIWDFFAGACSSPLYQIFNSCSSAGVSSLHCFRFNSSYNMKSFIFLLLMNFWPSQRELVHDDIAELAGGLTTLL